MGKLLDAAKAAIAKYDLAKDEGKQKAAAAVRAMRKKANAEAHAKRREVKELSDLLRTLEPQANRAERLKRGRIAAKAVITKSSTASS
jgi:hypothetical protein